ncbi:hypothetical protein [Streptomyces platensis]|uniref:hypothetical protein n=1 Tax=Streptomyces platensis TaxID=58346 RepID=UPI003F4CCB5B
MARTYRRISITSRTLIHTTLFVVLLLRATDGLQLPSVARRTSCSGLPMNPGAAFHEPDGRLMAGLGRGGGIRIEGDGNEEGLRSADARPTWFLPEEDRAPAEFRERPAGPEQELTVDGSQIRSHD